MFMHRAQQHGLVEERKKCVISTEVATRENIHEQEVETMCE